VDGLIFDHFGDFEGFVLETETGEYRRFRSRERQVLDLLRGAMRDRAWVVVVRESEDEDEVARIIIGI